MVQPHSNQIEGTRAPDKVHGKYRGFFVFFALLKCSDFFFKSLGILPFNPNRTPSLRVPQKHASEPTSAVFFAVPCVAGHGTGGGNSSRASGYTYT